MRVVTAMSGGVDSAVAAALLSDQGEDVVGLSMQLYDQRAPGSHFGSCCSLDDLQDARRTAAVLGISHYIVNFEREFDRAVVGEFVAEYVRGRTPIPCVRCNGDLKFTTLLDRARGLGAAHVATGHYARVVYDEKSGRYRLLRGLDLSKDQSYFLFTLTQTQLAAARFPVGHLHKTEVRAIARERGLPVADKLDSHEICFVADNDYAGLIERRTETAGAGQIRDAGGRTLGRHDGIHRYTVGQRKGLGLATGVPLYVIALEPATNAVVVGPKEALERMDLHASGVNWIAGEPPETFRRLSARIRHRHREAAVRVTPLTDARARVEFEEPQSAVAPGQAVVFYDGDDVIGGGWID